MRIADGCGLILHFGGISTEHPFKTVLGPNISGAYHIYEAARRKRRASSSRPPITRSASTSGARILDADCHLRPDSFYGLSKAFGELVGRLYWDKHGVESVIVRIGSSFPEAKDARMLATWFSYDDLTRLMIACGTAPRVGCAVIWGASANQRSFWGADQRDRDRLDAARQRRRSRRARPRQGTDDPVTERYQGGGYAAIDYSRTEPSPPSLFG